MRIHLSSRQIAVVKAVQKPKGAYVVAGGKFWPAEDGYPLAVVVESIAKAGQVVLFPVESGDVLVAFGGQPDRTQVLDCADEQGWVSAISRLALISEGSVLAVGDVDLPAQKAEVKWSDLPLVVTTKGAAKPVAIFGFCLVTLIASFISANSFISSAQADAASSVSIAKKKNAAIESEIEDMEKVIKAAPVVIAKRGGSPLPLPAMSFIEKLAPGASKIEVKNGAMVK